MQKRTLKALTSRTAPRPVPGHKVRTAEEYYNFSTPAMGDFLSPFDAFYNGISVLFPIFPAVSDVRFQNYLYLTDAAVALVRSYSRWCYETNIFATAGLGGLANYVINTGYEYSACPNKHSINKSEASPELLKRVDRFINRFQEKNDWHLKEWEKFAYIATRRDGDAFYRMHYEEDGIPLLEYVWPEKIRVLNDSSPDWSFGIYTKQPFDHKQLAYQVSEKNGKVVKLVRNWKVDNFAPYDGDHIQDNSRMIAYLNHLQPENKRGLSDFFNIRDALTEAQKLLQAGRQGETARQAITYIREWAAANVGTVATIQAGETDYQMPSYSTNASPRFFNTSVIVGGEVHDIPEGLTYKEPPQASADVLEFIHNATLKACSARWGIPASMLTGEVDSNFAAAIVEESPFMKRCHQDQGLWRCRFAEIFKCAMKMGVEWGVLPGNTLDQVDVSVTCPPLTVRDAKEETERWDILNQRGLLSRETWSKKEDLDWDKEQQQLEQEQSLPSFEKIVQPAQGENQKDTTDPSKAMYAQAAKR